MDSSPSARNKELEIKFGFPNKGKSKGGNHIAKLQFSLHPLDSNNTQIA